MTTPVPPKHDDDVVARHRTMDERLEEAFERYEEAYTAGEPLLPVARLDLALLLWPGRDLPPQAVRQQIARDGDALLVSTPPLA